MRARNTFFIVCFGVALVCLSFRFVLTKGERVSNWEIPQVVFPDDNPFSDASIELGGQLYFETMFSSDSSISCQSCHLITEGFADHLPLGTGVKNRMVSRNTPTLLNIGLHPYLMRDGKFQTLEEQVMGPILEHREFDIDPDELIRRLQSVEQYNELSQKAYGKAIDLEVVQKSIANFERILISDQTAFDKYMRGDETAMSPSAIQGWDLFKSDRLNCIQCHNGFDFTNYSFENTGTHRVYKDAGRAAVSLKEEDHGKFKVPTLRNVAVTYPYMHDGSFSTLDDVIEHYESGGYHHSNKSDYIKGFRLTKDERTNLIAFLKALTDERFLEEE